MLPHQRIVYALDHPTLEAAREGAERVAGGVGVLKVGLELFVRAGPEAVRIGERHGLDVFLDLKLHDIPETVERAVSAAAAHGVKYLTLHAQGGGAMLERAARRAEREGAGLTLLAVTVLTSLDERDLVALGVSEGPGEHALRLSRLARACGVGGVVCSPSEVARVRAALDPKAILVTPGIRAPGAPPDDQKRTATAREAVRRGASLVVVGRPIRDAQDPRAAAAAVAREIELALADTAPAM